MLNKLLFFFFFYYGSVIIVYAIIYTGVQIERDISCIKYNIVTN